MYYVSSNKGDLYGITNTNDGVEEFYTYDYICNNFDSSKIYGVNANNIDVWNPKKEIIKVKLSGERYLNCKDLILDLVDSKVVAIKYVSDSRNLIIPNFINELGVRCFKNRKTLENVIIPDSVILLSNNCFSGCDNLVSIKIPSSVVSLGKGCFSSCKNLESIILPDSVSILYDFLFS